jgi:FG-GAP-like repeat
MQHIGFSIRRTIILVGGAVLAFGTANTNLLGQSHPPGASPAFQASIATHQTGVESQTAPGFPGRTEMTGQGEIEIPAPTRSTFMASWPSVKSAVGYLLDVSTNESFSSYVDGYHDLDVGNVTARVVTGLDRGTTYYYRVRAYGGTGPAVYSAVISITTETTAGLIINPTFDGSITGNPNAAAIEAMINRAISFHEALFSDPITIQIRFRYSTTGPDGHPLPAGAIAQSVFVVYQLPWNIYIDALRADARTSNDSVANASLPGTALSPNIRPRSAGGRVVGLNTPPAMFADGTIGQGGPYDGIVTLKSSAPYQFTRPPSAGNLDAQRSTEHEVDEVIGLGSRLGHNGNDLNPQDLFSWSSPGVRNITTSGARYFSINGGATNIVSFNQNPDGDFGDWLSTACPQAHPYVQNAFGCAGQYSDIAATSPEGINLDVVGYDLANVPVGAGAARAAISDFNNDGHPDYVLRSPATRQTAIWYLNNNVFISGALGPSIIAGWLLDGVADFNRDTHPDYALFAPNTRQTALWYLSGPTYIAGAYGPTLPNGWELVCAADFNGDNKPDYVLYNAGTHQTAIWYLNNNVYVSGGFGPTLPAGWVLVGAADFDRDGHRDYVLFNSSDHKTAIWYLSGRTLVRTAFGPTIASGWALVAPADFNSDARPDYLLYDPAGRQTAIWYLNNNVYVSAAFGPSLPAGWSLVGQ